MQSLIAFVRILNETLRPYRQRILLVGGGVILALVLVIVALAFTARETMPGDALYSFKVNVYEPAIMATRLTDRTQLKYGVTLLETRFAELVSLRDNRTATVENVAPLLARTAETTTFLYDIMGDDSLTTEERLDTLFEATVQVKAMETIVQGTDDLSHSRNAFGDLLKSVSDNLNQTVTAYASSTDPDRVKQYLGSHIDAVSTLLPKVANGSAAQKQALTRIDVMQEEVADNNLPKAITAILRAEEALRVDGMVWGAERGESPVLTETATTTEGQ